MKRKSANGYVSFATNSLMMERASGVKAACCGVICLALICRRNQRPCIGFAMVAEWIVLKNWWVRSLIGNYVLSKPLFLLYNRTLKIIYYMKLSTSKTFLCDICENKYSRREKSFFPPHLQKLMFAKLYLTMVKIAKLNFHEFFSKDKIFKLTCLR